MNLSKTLIQMLKQRKTMNDKSFNIEAIRKACEYHVPYQKIGKILSNTGGLYKIDITGAIIGSSVEFVTESSDRSLGEVVSICERGCFVMPYEEISGINSETRVYLKELITTAKIGPELLGRIVDFKCQPIDKGKPLKDTFEVRSIFGSSINPLERPMIDKTLSTGIHAIDCFTTVGKGQRINIMAGAGVGKSVTMGMIARNTTSDINVIALVGERGREVLEFIENDLGKEGLKKSIVVVATSDQSPLIKIKAAYTATTIAEYFRDQKKDVILMVDSITRFAMAHREISLGAGEPPGLRGYTPSVFSKLSKLMERAGTKKKRRNHNRILHCFSGGRGYRRTDLRCCSCHIRWTHYSKPRLGDEKPFPSDRYFTVFIQGDE